MNVACRVLWGGSRSTKPCVFPCKVAAAGERYLVCDLCHVDGLGPRILLNIQLADITDITGQRLEPCGHL